MRLCQFIEANINYGNMWWRHQMEAFSALLALRAGNSPVSGEFPSQMPVTQSFDVFFDLHLNNTFDSDTNNDNESTLRCL